MIRLIVLFCLFLSATVFADVRYTWSIPQSRLDGSALDPNEIKNYTIKYTIDGVAQPDIVTANGQVIEIIAQGQQGTYVGKIATTDTAGVTSAYSEETTCKPPVSPLIFRCELVQ